MARKSSRKYYTAKPVYETRVIPGAHKKNDQTGKLESFYLMMHPEGMSLVKVIDGEKTVFLSRYGGCEHEETRMAVFDPGHLQRVNRTFVQDCITTAAGGKVKNQVRTKAEYLRDLKKLKMGL